MTSFGVRFRSVLGVIERYVEKCRKKRPDLDAKIAAIVYPYKLPDGRLRNDDNIMHELSGLDENTAGGPS